MDLETPIQPAYSFVSPDLGHSSAPAEQERRQVDQLIYGNVDPQVYLRYLENNPSCMNHLADNQLFRTMVGRLFVYLHQAILDTRSPSDQHSKRRF